MCSLLCMNSSIQPCTHDNNCSNPSAAYHPSLRWWISSSGETWHMPPWNILGGIVLQWAIGLSCTAQRLMGGFSKLPVGLSVLIYDFAIATILWSIMLLQLQSLFETSHNGSQSKAINKVHWLLNVNTQNDLKGQRSPVSIVEFCFFCLCTSNCVA